MSAKESTVVITDSSVSEVPLRTLYPSRGRSPVSRGARHSSSTKPSPAVALMRFGAWGRLASTSRVSSITT